MKKNWKVFLSAGGLVFSVAMILLFPREDYTAAATVSAILFWLSFQACIWQTTELVRQSRGGKRRRKYAGRRARMIRTLRGRINRSFIYIRRKEE